MVVASSSQESYQEAQRCALRCACSNLITQQRGGDGVAGVEERSTLSRASPPSRPLPEEWRIIRMQKSVTSVHQVPPRLCASHMRNDSLLRVMRAEIREAGQVLFSLLI